MNSKNFKNKTAFSLLTFSQYGNDLDATVAAFSSSSIIPRIIAFTFNSSTGKTLHLNGTSMSLAQGVESSGTPYVATTGLTSFPGSMIGGYTAGISVYYNGDLCEIMMFSRALKTEERRSIESYLSKKWAITVS